MTEYVKPEVRLQLRKMELQRKCSRSSARLRDNMEYMRANVAGVVAQQVVESVEEKTPFVANVIRRFLPHRKYRQPSVNKTIGAQTQGAGLLMGSLLPLLLDLGRNKLLGFGLRRIGGLLRFIFKRVFRLIS